MYTITNGIVTRDLDGKIVSPAQSAEDPDFVAYIDWVNAGGEPVMINYAVPVVPHAVSMRQARLALLGAGLLTAVNEALAVMPGIEGEAARIEWEYATEVMRDSALVTGLSYALGLTEAQLDALFIAGAAL